MKTRIIRALSIGIMLMGLIHIVATFTPLIADKLAMLPEEAEDAFTYFSLACGTLLIMGGGVTFDLSGKVKEHHHVRRLYIFVLAILAIDGVLAVCFMPHNPCAWIIFALTVGLSFCKWSK